MVALRLLPVLVLMSAVLTGGCTSTPEPPTDAITPARLPFPGYVISPSSESLGGAAWRGGQAVHALRLDGQSCGVDFEGRVRCWRIPDPSPIVTPVAPSLPTASTGWLARATAPGVEP
ncbi:hypothetical protein [Thiocystis violacea]|uniref:hypothetical protein n=1 Tax=Thiocystis violacea TaxID=13725 RepID=UPI0019059CCE|nr:hypothetical protein [Thiocystis violacea]